MNDYARALICAAAFATATAHAQVGAPSPQAPSVLGWDHYAVSVRDWDPRLRVTLTQQIGRGADLYLRRGAPPTMTLWDARSATPGTTDENLVLDGGSQPTLASGVWFVGVLRPQGTVYSWSATPEPAPSPEPGAGANLYRRSAADKGATFRVWAPFAAGVRVAGDFNAWNGGDAPLAAEGGGWWSLDVRNLAAGARYRFVIDGAAGTQWKIDPRARAVTSSVGDGVVVDPAAFDWGAAQWSMPAWNDLVVYELHVGTFNDQPGGAVGTFDSAIAGLPYLANLGVNAIQLMPTAEFPGSQSWGYETSHPFAVEVAYGGEEALKRLVKAAHGHGLAVFADVLYNHWGPGDLHLWRFDGWSQGPWGGIFFYNDWRAATPWGDTRPDFGRGEVRTYIRDNVLYWLDEFRLDGLRFDSTVNIRNTDNGLGADLPEGWSLLQWLNDEIDRTQPWKLAIAEDMWRNEWITKDVGAGGAGFDAQWDAGFVHPVRAALVAPSDAARDMNQVAGAIRLRYNADAFERVVYTDSHDESANGNARLPEQIWPGYADSWPSKKRSTLGAALALTAPGIPMLLQGQEFLEDGWFSDADPLDWNRAATFAGIRRLYRDLIALRRDLHGTTRGLQGQHLNVHHVNDADKLIAFHRWDQGGPGDDVLVVANFADRAYPSYLLGAPRAGLWQVRFNSDWSGYDAAFGDWPAFDAVAQAGGMHGMPYRLDLSIGPYTVLILSQ